MTTTYEQALARHDITIPDHLVAQAEVPQLSGLQRQGDLIIIPRRPGKTAREGVLVGSRGVQVVAGEATGNTHWLDSADPDCPVTWFPSDGRGATLGVVDVPVGTHAVLTHTDEHGANALAPGCYEIRRQREQAEEQRLVVD